MIGKTDSDGIAGSDCDAGPYTVHILKVPEGYASDDTEYAAPSTPGTMTIVLRAEGSEEAKDGDAKVDSAQLGLR